MSKVVVGGMGAVSPAGWGVSALRQAIKAGARLPVQELPCPGRAKPFKVLRVPVMSPRPTFIAHPRLRRTSPIAHYAVGAALEALGKEAAQFESNGAKLGIIYCAMAGCVNFSRRFYDETLKDPATASPVIFPETVFNAPASHLGALLGTTAINYTLVGDPGSFVQGLALAADWLVAGRVDGCLVIGAEELDWLVAQAFDLFDPDAMVSEGAGALFLRRAEQSQGSVELQGITDSYLFSNKAGRAAAAAKARAEAGIEPANALLCDGTQAVQGIDHDEEAAWSNWSGKRVSPKRICGEAFMAASAWQCVMGADAVAAGDCDVAQVSVVGTNQQAIAAQFGKS